jgi:mRNA-degrading endonuclease toxin of MazEF toxin-antitoxin module
MANEEKYLEIQQFGIYIVDLGKPHSDRDNFHSSVSSGRRPVVVLGNKMGLKHSPVVHVIPLTTRLAKAQKKKLPVHVQINVEGDVKSKCDYLVDSVIMAEQLTVIPKHKIQKYVGTISEAKTLELKAALNLALGI